MTGQVTHGEILRSIELGGIRPSPKIGSGIASGSRLRIVSTRRIVRSTPSAGFLDTTPCTRARRACCSTSSAAVPGMLSLAFGLAFRNVVGVASDNFKRALYDPGQARFPARCFPLASPKVAPSDPCRAWQLKYLNLKDFLVGGREIEPLTPSMLRKRSFARQMPTGAQATPPQAGHRMKGLNREHSFSNAPETRNISRRLSSAAPASPPPTLKTGCARR
jgi:hypothetical protein